MTVTVVGGGIAGSVAALAAARHREVQVRLVSEAETSLGAASGLIDVLGYTPDGEGPVTDPFAAIPDLPEAHPYQTVGVEAVRDSLALFDGVTSDRYAGHGTDRNALVPTHLGNLKPTARYPQSVAPGLASREETTLLVGGHRLTEFDATLAGDRLDRVVPYLVWGTTVEFPGDDLSLETTDVADLLEADAVVGTDDGEEYARDVLARRLNRCVEMEGRVGLPAVLGYEETAEIREGLSVAAEADVFEIPTGPPSLLGLRLERSLNEALGAAGVERVTGRVTGAEVGAEGIERLAVDGEGAVETEATVLATGGFVGGGLGGDRRSVREPVFGCHVPHPEDRYEWFEDRALGDHPFAAFGVETDAGLRPLDAEGDPEYPRLRAAGATLGGYNLAAEKSGAGVSIATGYVAGRLAAEDAS